MEMISLQKVIEILGEAVLRTMGPTRRNITHPVPIHEAQNEFAITFCNKSNPDALKLIRCTKAGVVICREDYLLDELKDSGKTLIAVRDPRLSFIRLVKGLFTELKPKGIHPTAVIDPEARIHPDTYIGPFTYVGKCVISEGTIIYGHVHIYSKTRIGRNVIIHAGTVIGADGFGYQRNAKAELEKFPHLGGVVIEDNVEIGSNTCIDRGTLGDTIIMEGAKIDNLVHIAHNVTVGKHAMVIAHAMVGGSAHVGNHASVSPCACVRDGISIGDQSIVGLGAVVARDVPDSMTVMGTPARPADEYKALLQVLKKFIE